MASAYPPEVKAAVLAELASGNTISFVAKKHGISRWAIKKWHDQAGLNEAFSGEVATQKKEELGRQILDLTSESILTMGFLLRSVRDPSWFRERGGVEVATLLGVISDKTIRLLQALQPIDVDPAGPEALSEGVHPSGMADC